MIFRTSAIVLAAWCSSAVYAQTVEDLTKPCAQCHGESGVSVTPKTPHLNGQLSFYLQQEIGGLAQKTRVTSIADHVPAAWTGKQITAVSNFYAASKAPRSIQSTDAQLVTQGEAIYQKRCADCHPNNGRDSDHDAPLMAGQEVNYLIEQTRAFVSGKRKFVFMMDDAFRGASPAELDSVAHFFANQTQSKK